MLPKQKGKKEDGMMIIFRILTILVFSTQKRIHNIDSLSFYDSLTNLLRDKFAAPTYRYSLCVDSEQLNWYQSLKKM